MKRLLLISLLFLSLPFLTEGKKVTFGCEWGMGVSYAKYHVFNYLYESGRRHQGSTLETGRRMNANFMAHVGYDLSRRVNLSLYTGHEGISDEMTVIPVTLRATVFPTGSEKDGMLVYLDAGAGLDESSFHALLGRAGIGYRLALTEVTNLDFILSYRLALTRPELLDPDSRRPIAENRIARNDLFLNKITFSIGLNF